jgi:hypothetical protein
MRRLPHLLRRLGMMHTSTSTKCWSWFSFLAVNFRVHVLDVSCKHQYWGKRWSLTFFFAVNVESIMSLMCLDWSFGERLDLSDLWEVKWKKKPPCLEQLDLAKNGATCIFMLRTQSCQVWLWYFLAGSSILFLLGISESWALMRFNLGVLWLEFCFDCFKFEKHYCLE